MCPSGPRLCPRGMCSECVRAARPVSDTIFPGNFSACVRFSRVLINVEWAARRLAHIVPRQRRMTHAAYYPLLNVNTRNEASVWATLAASYNRRWNQAEVKPNSLYVNYNRHPTPWLQAMRKEYVSTAPSSCRATFISPGRRQLAAPLWRNQIFFNFWLVFYVRFYLLFLFFFKWKEDYLNLSYSSEDIFFEKI